MTLYKVGTSNAFATTLSGAVATGDTSITLTTATGLQSPGVICIDRLDSSGNSTPALREYISFDGISTSTLTGCVRGLGGSAAQAHASGAIIEENFSVTHWNDFVDALSNVVNPASGDLDTTKVADLGSAQTLINKTITELVNAGAITIPTGTDTLVARATADTLTNKRITSRIDTVATSATPTININTTDIFTITALSDNIVSFTSNLSGAPTNGQKLIIRILDAGAAKTIAWGTSFVSRGSTLPTTTVASKYLYVGFMYNSAAGVWDCVAVSQEA